MPALEQLSALSDALKSLLGKLILDHKMVKYQYQREPSRMRGSGRKKRRPQNGALRGMLEFIYSVSTTAALLWTFLPKQVK